MPNQASVERINIDCKVGMYGIEAIRLWCNKFS